MFTTLVAVLVALALGHVAPAAAVALRGFGFYRRWLQWLDAHAAENGFWRSRQGWVLAVLPWVLGCCCCSGRCTAACSACRRCCWAWPSW